MLNCTFVKTADYFLSWKVQNIINVSQQNSNHSMHNRNPEGHVLRNDAHLVLRINRREMYV